MRYLLMVSHGTLAPGFESVLDMLAGARPTTLVCTLPDGMGADVYLERLRSLIEPIGEGDEVVLLADIIGGSPLTNALSVLDERGLLARTMAFGGMNLPMAMAAAMGLESLDADELRAALLAEGRAGLREVTLDIEASASEDDDEDEDI